MARTTAVNFAGGLQFPMASAATDLFKKEDVQTLALAVDQHTHDGSGKGLNVVINKSIDIADWFRSTGHTTTLPSTGAGIEMYYDTTLGGALQCSSGAAWVPMYMAASSYSFVIGGVASALTIAADRSVTIPTTLTVTGAVTCQAALNVASNIACTGNLLMTATNSMQFTHGGQIYDKTDASGYVNISNLAVVGAAQVAANLTVTGDVVGARVFIGTDATRYIQPSGPASLAYIAAVGGGHAFILSSSAAAPVSTGNLTVTGTGAFSGAVTAGQVTVANSFYGNGCVINNGTANLGLYLYVNGGAGGSSGWQVIPSSIDYKTNVTPIGNALDIVNDATLHGVHYTVSPDGIDPFETYGFIAEDWHLVAPETVSYLDGKPQGMDYGQIISIVFEALKMHISQVDARLAALEARAA